MTKRAFDRSALILAAACTAAGFWGSAIASGRGGGAGGGGNATRGRQAIAGAFDDRITLLAPVASSGGGTPAFRFSGFEHGGNEGLSEMSRKYPNWFSPHLYEFFGHVEKLPFALHGLFCPVGLIRLLLREFEAYSSS